MYQSDFNAERQAREKIAGEKADLAEEVRRLKNAQSGGSPVFNEVFTIFFYLLWNNWLVLHFCP